MNACCRRCVPTQCAGTDARKQPSHNLGQQSMQSYRYRRAKEQCPTRRNHCIDVWLRSLLLTRLTTLYVTIETRLSLHPAFAGVGHFKPLGSTRLPPLVVTPSVLRRLGSVLSQMLRLTLERFTELTRLQLPITRQRPQN